GGPRDNFRHGRQLNKRSRIPIASMAPRYGPVWPRNDWKPAPQFTATASVLYAHELGLVPITTPSYSRAEQRPGRGIYRDVQARLREWRRTTGCRNATLPARAQVISQRA